MAFAAVRRLPLLVRRSALTCDEAESLLRRLFARQTRVSFAVRLWDGRRVALGPVPAVTFAFADPDVFSRCLGSDDPAAFAEAYVGGRMDIEGEIDEAARVALALREFDPGLPGRLFAASYLRVPVSRHTVREDERDVRAHYDLSNDFFRLFLDHRMVYSCAYFERPDQSLEAAQARKLDLICRKLNLAPGEDFLDIGCGWAGLLLWAAERYGVRATGLTLSVNQQAEAARAIERAGLAERVTVVREHYDALGSEQADAIASVGMYEHVGHRRLPDYCRAVFRALRPGGLFLNHGITLPVGEQARTGGAFIFRHIFPGAELAPVSTVAAALEDAGFEVLDVQSLRPHYALTLREWYARFKRARAEAVRLSSERTVRAWEVYLTGCARAFEIGLVAVHQILALKPGDHRPRPPLTRAGWDLNLGC